MNVFFASCSISLLVACHRGSSSSAGEEPLPAASVVTIGNTDLLATGRFITALPRSVISSNASQSALKALPIELPARPWPVEIITLKNRTLNPVAQRFIEQVRAFTSTMGARSAPETNPA